MPEIAYHYEVGGRFYIGTVIAPGRWWSQHSAFAAVDRFPRGGTADVYYLATNPSHSLLEPGLHPATFDSFLVGMMLFSIGFPFLMGPFWRDSEYQKPDGTMTFIDGTFASGAFLACVLLFFGSALALFVVSFW